MPDVEFDMATHGDTNFEVKTAGMKKLSHMTISKISPVDAPDNTFRNWSLQIQDTKTGGGLLPSQYKRTCVVQHYAPDGVTVVEQWEFDGAWPQKINGLEFNRKSSENSIQSIELCIDEEN